jgi:hypothetical protein
MGNVSKESSPKLIAILPYYCFPLIVGTLVVVSHTVWEADWRVIVTLIGWLAFIKGIVRVVFPKLAMRFDGKIAKKPFLLKIFAIIILLLAAFLCFAGYMS